MAIVTSQQHHTERILDEMMANQSRLLDPSEIFTKKVDSGV
jgi:hypothetical protein